MLCACRAVCMQVEVELSESLGDVSQVIFFLMGAMTVVEVVDANQVSTGLSVCCVCIRAAVLPPMRFACMLSGVQNACMGKARPKCLYMQGKAHIMQHAWLSLAGTANAS